MTDRPAVVVIADDLTGAADTGVQFARVGLPTCVWLGRGAPLAAGATVFDADTRSLDAVGAARRVAEIAVEIHRADPELVYKKVDSTVRGNVGAESAALIARLGRRLAVVAPAFPANRRTTRGGIQFVAGVPVHLTAAAADPAHPMPHPTIPAALRAQSDLPIEQIDLATVRRDGALIAGLRAILSAHDRAFVVVDAETDADLATIANAVAALGTAALPVGSAGLAARLADGLRRAASPLRRPTAERPLLVCGSLNPATLSQVSRLEIELGASFDPFVPGATRAVAARLASGPALVATGRARLDITSQAVAGRLAARVARVVGSARPDGLILTGGDVARAVLTAIGARGVELTDEILPGMPVGRIVGGRLDGHPVVTKAGGFGPPDALVEALRYLHAREESR